MLKGHHSDEAYASFESDLDILLADVLSRLDRKERVDIDDKEFHKISGRVKIGGAEYKEPTASSSYNNPSPFGMFAEVYKLPNEVPSFIAFVVVLFAFSALCCIVYWTIYFDP